MHSSPAAWTLVVATATVSCSGEEVQLAYARRGGTRWRMPAKWYRLDLGREQSRLTILALDSNLGTGAEAAAQGGRPE